MRAVAPGRVNLIGDHVDYTGGLVLPMAIDMRTTIDFEFSDTFELVSNDDPEPVRFDPRTPPDRASLPVWGRYVEAVASLTPGARGIRGRVSTTLPVGAGLSSSAALEVAVAVALGHTVATPAEAVAVATMCREAEHLATGVPTGIMDQLCVTAAREGNATLIDCRTLEVGYVAVPDDVTFVVRFVAHRTLVGSEYADRVAECAAAERDIGPLRDATLGDVARIGDPVVRRRARHVVTENERVREFVAALAAGDHVAAGLAMVGSHRSLADDFAVSTPAMDAAVAELVGTPGVLGARMTGGGFGGCVVAMCTADAKVAGWRVSPSAGPFVVTVD